VRNVKLLGGTNELVGGFRVVLAAPQINTLPINTIPRGQIARMVEMTCEYNDE